MSWGGHLYALVRFVCFFPPVFVVFFFFLQVAEDNYSFVS